MRKAVLLLFVAVSAVVFSGCTTHYRDAGADYLMRPHSVGETAYYTEYDLKQKQITAQGKASVLFGIFQIAENKRCLSVANPNLSVFSILNDILSPTYKAVSNAKSIALYNACTQSEADQLLGVTFDYVVNDYLVYATVDCKVKGFPAVVKGVKKIDKKPIIINKWQKIEYVEPYENPIVDKEQQPSISINPFN